MRHWPSNMTPSSTTTTGASTSPKTRAVPRSSTRSVPSTLPTTSPLMRMTPARMEAFNTAFSPMMSVSFEEILHLNLPYRMTVPLHEYLQYISDTPLQNANDL